MEYNSQSKPEASDQSVENLPKWDQPPAEASYPYQERKQDLKHSGPGIASFVISLVSLLGYIIAFVIIGSMASSIIDESGKLIGDRSSQVIMLLGMSVLALSALNVIGVVIGIIGLVLRNRRKVFGIIGTIINGVIVLVFMLLVSAILVNAGAV